MLLVLGSRRGEAVRKEPLRVVEQMGQPVGDRRRHHGHGAGGHQTAAIAQRFEHLADQQYQRRVQPLAFAYRAVQRHLLLEAVEAHGAGLAVDVLRLVPHARQVGGLPEELQAGPGREHRAGVLAGEQHRQKDAGDLVVAQRAAVLVTRLHERLHEIVGIGPGTPARRHDPAEQLGHFPPCPVAVSVGRGRKPGEEESQRVNAVLQLVIGLGETGIHPVADLLSDQAPAGDLDGELVHRVRQIDLPLRAEGVGEPLRLVEHDEGELAHGGFAKRRKQEPQLLRHDLGRGVVSHAASEDGHREPVDRLGVQLILRRPEVKVVRFGSGEENEFAGAETETEKLAMLAPAAAQHGDRIPLEFRQIAEQRPPARERRSGRLRPRRELRRREGRRTVSPVRHPRPQWMNGSIEKRAVFV